MCSKPQFTDLTYMRRTRLCGPMTIIFGSVIKSQYTSLNIQFGVNRLFHVVKPQYTDLTYMGGTTPCRSMTTIFGSVIQSQYISLNIKFGVNRTFHLVPPQYTDLTYMGGTRPCRSMTIIFGSVIYSQYISLNIKFGVNRTFHVLKTTVYRFDLYGRYQTLWTDDDRFWKCYLKLVYKPKYPLWCESDVSFAQDHSLPL